MSIPIPTDIAHCVAYTEGLLLTADLMTLDQQMPLRLGALQNRMLYTAGVLEGLDVTVGADGAVSIASGAGFDATGRFLVLPGEGALLPVPPGSTNPSYVHLLYPAIPRVIAAESVKDLSAVPELLSSEASPDNGILLAEITLDRTGKISAIIDRREPVRSRLPITLSHSTVATDT